MNTQPKWPNGSTSLLAKRISDSTSGQDYVNWAVQALIEEFDSPSLAVLAGLDSEKDFLRSEAEKLFVKAISELGLQILDKETILRNHFDNLVIQIRTGIINPEIGVEQIHKDVISPLEHPQDLQPWCFLWEGNYPMQGGVIPKEEYLSEIIQFAKEWQIEKTVSE